MDSRNLLVVSIHAHLSKWQPVRERLGWPSPNVTGLSSLAVRNEFCFLSIAPISANRRRTSLISGTVLTRSDVSQTNTSFNASTVYRLNRELRLSSLPFSASTL